MIPRHLTLRLLTLMAAASAASPLLVAQTSATAPAPAASEEVITLDAFEINEVPIEQNILPTSRPFNSVFGTDQNIVDIPRSVTIISREQLSAINIRDVRDFAKLTSSSYTRTNFGAPGNPDIRGQSGDVFQNGMRERTTSNGNGLPIDFNAVESVNIVKGPATAVQGASSYVGGYVDLVTKRPYFDQARGTTFVTVGTYDKLAWGVDYGAPINEKLAYRISYTGEESSGGYFRDDYTKTQSLYAATTWRASDNYELFINTQLAYFEYVENFGVNRPTQNFIKNGLYATGTNTNSGTVATPADPQNSANVRAFGNTVAFGPEEKLSRRARLLKPGDNSLGRNFKLQAIQTFTLDPDTRIVNNNLFTYVRRDTDSSYAYSEIIDPAITFESRWEYQKTFESLTLNTGVAGRYTKVKAYNNYFFQPAGVWDLTQDSRFINVYNSATYPGGAAPVPGYPNRFATPGTFNNDTNDSDSLSLSPFVQSEYKINDSLSVLSGGRVDFININSIDPLLPGARERGTTLGLPNLNASLVYKITPKFSTYATYNYSENTGGAVGNGGGFSPTFTKDKLKQPSELYEIGTKWSLMDGKVFLGAALYEQTRTNKPLIGPIQEFNYQGAEFEVNYQPNKNFYTTFSAGFIDGKVGATGFEAINTNIRTFYPEIVRANATGVRAQGLPKQQFNALVSYTFDNGFGASLNGTLHGEINNNWAGTLVIPWQYEFDTAIFYKRGAWEYRLAISNLTNERNLAPPNGVYGNESILVLPGTQAEFTVAFKF